MNGAAAAHHLNQFCVLIEQLEHHWVWIDPGLPIPVILTRNRIEALLIQIFIGSHAFDGTLSNMPHNPFYARRIDGMIRLQKRRDKNFA